jgi:hypothetical protein
MFLNCYLAINRRSRGIFTVPTILTSVKGLTRDGELQRSLPIPYVDSNQRHERYAEAVTITKCQTFLRYEED